MEKQIDKENRKKGAKSEICAFRQRLQKEKMADRVIQIIDAGNRSFARRIKTEEGILCGESY